jgi:preprotein translocase subunit YajC
MNMISIAYAQEIAGEVATEAAIEAPSTASAFAWNMGLILVMVLLFYVLLIRPQQKRFNEHKEMLSALKKGDKVVTAGGLVGKIDKLAGDDEVIVDLGGGTKVTALLSTIQSKAEKAEPKKDDKK